MARQNRVDLTVGIALGSSIQIALFVAPVLVLASYFIAPQPLELSFSRAEVGALFIAVLIGTVVAGDGRSNWYKGVQLITVYLIIALMFYLHSGGRLTLARTRVLDPVERVSEVIFGVLMAMTFIGSLSVATRGPGEVRTMMIAALGCNIAWGLADAVMYLVGTLTERTRARTQARQEGRPPAEAPGLRFDDLRGALGVFLLVAASTFPLVVPFLVFRELGTALLGSRLVAVAMLFLGGWLLARYSGGNRWLAGTAMAAVGVVLIGAIMALGG